MERAAAQNVRARNVDEETPLLGNGNGRPGPAKDGGEGLGAKFKKHCSVDVSKNWADLVLLFCYIITGLLDSSAVFIWGSFVSMQTGESIPRYISLQHDMSYGCLT